MSPISEFKQQLKAGHIEFEDSLALIERCYEYTPCTFHNGLGASPIVNEAGQNEGSCRIFAFALLQGLSLEETLACFGRHYQAVLAHPDASDHANIRRVMRDGLNGLHFLGTALKPRAGAFE